MCVRNNICCRIRYSDLSLLPWSWGLCIFVEQLYPVASRQVSRHLKGRSVCHTSSSPLLPTLTSPPLLSSMSSIPLLLLSTPCWVSMGSRPNKQTNRTTEKAITQTRLVWAWGSDGERSCLLSGPVPFHSDGREGLPGHSDPHFCLTSRRDHGGPHHWHIILWPNTQLAAATGL